MALVSLSNSINSVIFIVFIAFMLSPPLFCIIIIVVLLISVYGDLMVYGVNSHNWNLASNYPCLSSKKFFPCNATIYGLDFFAGGL